MAFLKSLPENAGIGDVYRTWQDHYRPWIRMGQAVMGGDSELGKGEREMIATYVSVLNGCEYCRASHLPTMEKLGIKPKVIEQLIDDVDNADIDNKLKPIIRFCRKLTLEPAVLTQADADEVFDAGWSEETLHDAVAVTCRFAFMNRLTLGLGLTPLDEDTASALSDDRINLGYDMMEKGSRARRRRED